MIIEPPTYAGPPCKVQRFCSALGKGEWKDCGKPSGAEPKTALDGPVCPECWAEIREPARP